MTEATSQKRRKWDQVDSSPEPANKLSKTETKDEPIDPIKAATLAAAKINALYAGKKATATTTTTATTTATAANEDASSGSSTPEVKAFSTSHPPPPPSSKVEFFKKIEINDLKNRYMLTRGATQADISQTTGAEITTRGKYYPDPNLATEKEPPLYLYICAPNQESLDEAVNKVNELIETAKVPTGPPAHFTSSSYRRPPYDHDRKGAEDGGATDSPYSNPNGYSHRPPRKFYDEKVTVDIPESPHYNLRAKLVGPQGAYVKHISSVTGCRIQVRGKGSGFYEQETGIESEEPLYIHVSTPRQEMLPKAVQLAKDLVGTIKDEIEKRNQQNSYGRGYQPHQPHQPHQPQKDQYQYTPSYDYQDYNADPSHSAATSSTAATNSYAGYDYSQYAYYEQQQQYDPSYYNQYYQYYPQQENHTVTDTAQHPAPPPPPPPPPAETNTEPTSPPPPPPTAASSSPSLTSPSVPPKSTSSSPHHYNSVPPPSHY